MRRWSPPPGVSDQVRADPTCVRPSPRGRGQDKAGEQPRLRPGALEWLLPATEGGLGAEQRQRWRQRPAGVVGRARQEPGLGGEASLRRADLPDGVLHRRWRQLVAEGPESAEETSDDQVA